MIATGWTRFHRRHSGVVRIKLTSDAGAWQARPISENHPASMSGLVHQLSRSVSAIGRVSRASQADSDMEAPILAGERETSASRSHLLAAETDTPETPSKDLQQVGTAVLGPASESQANWTRICEGRMHSVAEAGHLQAHRPADGGNLPQQLAEGAHTGSPGDAHSCGSYQGMTGSASLVSYAFHMATMCVQTHATLSNGPHGQGLGGVVSWFERQNNWVGWVEFLVLYCAVVALYLPGIMFILASGYVFG